MKRKIIVLLIVISPALSAFCQKPNFGFSVSALNDVDWNKPMADFQYTFSNMSLQSDHPLKFGLCFEEKFRTVSPSISVNLIYRNIKYSEHYAPLTNFNHFTMELPLNFTYRKSIQEGSSLIMNIGGGCTYNISTNKFQAGVLRNDTLIYSFNLVNPNKISAFMNGGIGIECSLKKLGSLQFKLEYCYQFSKQLQYEHTDKYFNQITNKYRMNYASLGFVYYFPICKKTD